MNGVGKFWFPVSLYFFMFLMTDDGYAWFLLASLGSVLGSMDEQFKNTFSQHGRRLRTRSRGLLKRLQQQVSSSLRIKQFFASCFLVDLTFIRAEIVHSVAFKLTTKGWMFWISFSLQLKQHQMEIQSHLIKVYLFIASLVVFLLAKCTSQKLSFFSRTHKFFSVSHCMTINKSQICHHFLEYCPHVCSVIPWSTLCLLDKFKSKAIYLNYVLTPTKSLLPLSHHCLTQALFIFYERI